MKLIVHRQDHACSDGSPRYVVTLTNGLQGEALRSMSRYFRQDEMIGLAGVMLAVAGGTLEGHAFGESDPPVKP